MRIVFVGGPLHRVVMETDSPPQHVTAYAPNGAAERYERWEGAGAARDTYAIPGADIYAPLMIDWATFRRLLAELKAMHL